MATKPVIVGADGSRESLRAVKWAAREAALRGTSLRIVAVPPLPPRMTSTPATPGTVSDVVEQSTSEALAAAAQQAAAQEASLTIETHLVAGAPAEVLTDAAQDAALLVLGSRGAGGFSSLILGSVSRYVATHAAAPVVVAREETMSADREIVVGVRDPAQAEAALGFGFEEAALRHARLRAVHAWSSPVPWHAEAPAEETSRLESAVAAWREKFPEVETRWEMVHAHPGRVLARLVRARRPGRPGQARDGRVPWSRRSLGHPRGTGPRSRPRGVGAGGLTASGPRD